MFHYDKEKPVTTPADFIETSQDSQYFHNRCQPDIDSGSPKILSTEAGIPLQTVKTLIRLLHYEQSDQGLHCLPFLHQDFDAFAKKKITFLSFCIM